ncbi:hypothetical protein G9P44_003785 [Scheffersomyces stipitis]|nr:hypothetical protein G9P44_003785 [Scheffersomyces stipitis]
MSSYPALPQSSVDTILDSVKYYSSAQIESVVVASAGKLVGSLELSTSQPLEQSIVEELLLLLALHASEGSTMVKSVFDDYTTILYYANGFEVAFLKKKS